MKKVFYVSIITLVFNHHLFGQSAISGYLADQQEQPVPFANVILFPQSDSTMVTGSVSSVEGYFNLTANPGDYRLKFSMVGYKPLWVDVSVMGPDIDLGIIIMEEGSRILSEIMVEADKMPVEYLPDRLVLNVKDQVLSGGTALDLLERSPGVKVDQLGNDIQLMGKTGVTVMINGKESRVPPGALVQMLRGVNAESVDKIELITNPPAKADAEGLGGIINIVLTEKENFGTNGALSLTGGYGYGEKGGINFDLAHSTKKIDFTANYSLMWDRTHQVFTNSKQVLLPDGLHQSSTVSERFPIQFNNSLRVGVDYRISPKTSVGSVFSAYSNRWEMDALNHSSFIEPNDTSFLTTDNHEINRWDHLMSNFNLSHEFNPDQKVNFDFDYLYYFDKNPTTYLNELSESSDNSDVPEKTTSEKLTPIRFYVLKFDYSRKFGERVNMETGGKATFSSFRNDVKVKHFEEDSVVVDPEFSQVNVLNENILAGYVSVTTQFEKNISLTTGLRYEYTDSDLKNGVNETLIDRYYGQLFPNVLIVKKWGELSKIHLSYQRRITRPTFDDMAPFVIFLDPKTFFSGNAALLPGLSNSVKLEAHYKDLLVSLQYSDEKNPIARYQIQVVPGTSQQLIAARNLLNRKAMTMFISQPVTVTPWWQMQNSLLVSREHIKDNSEGILSENNQWYFQFNTTQMVDLPRDFKFEVNGYYHSKSLYGAMEQRRTYNLSMGIGKELAGDKGTIKLSLSNIFNINDWDFTADLPDQKAYIDQAFIPEPRVVRFTYARKFGSGKSGSSRRRKTGSEEEQKRVGG